MVKSFGVKTDAMVAQADSTRVLALLASTRFRHLRMVELIHAVFSLDEIHSLFSLMLFFRLGSMCVFALTKFSPFPSPPIHRADSKGFLALTRFNYYSAAPLTVDSACVFALTKFKLCSIPLLFS